MPNIYGTPTNIAKTFLPGFPSYPVRHFPLPFFFNSDSAYFICLCQYITIEGDCPPVYWIAFVYAFNSWVGIEPFKVCEMFPSGIPDCRYLKKSVDGRLHFCLIWVNDPKLPATYRSCRFTRPLCFHRVKTQSCVPGMYAWLLHIGLVK